MKINMNKNLMNLDGKEMKDQNMGKLLANILATKADGIDPIKAYDWAMTVWKGDDLEIDRSDIDKLKTLVLKTELLTTLAKAQILLSLEVKDANAPKK